MHVKQSIKITNIPYKKTSYIESKYFSLDKYEINGQVTLNHNEPFSLVSVIDGCGLINGLKITKWQYFIICHDVHTIDLQGQMTLMVTTLWLPFFHKKNTH